MIQVVDSKSFPYLKKRKKDIKNTLVSSVRGRAEEERGYKERGQGTARGTKQGRVLKRAPQENHLLAPLHRLGERREGPTLEEAGPNVLGQGPRPGRRPKR